MLYFKKTCDARSAQDAGDENGQYRSPHFAQLMNKSQNTKTPLFDAFTLRASCALRPLYLRV